LQDIDVAVGIDEFEDRLGLGIDHPLRLFRHEDLRYWGVTEVFGPKSAFWPLLSASALSVTYPDAQRAHIGTKDALNNEVKLAFGQGDLSWKRGHLRLAYGARGSRFREEGSAA
jgi:hypothetical protein